jgi:hypothetical protein
MKKTLYYFWDVRDGKYLGITSNNFGDVSIGGSYVYQAFELEIPDFPGVPEPELEDGIYRVRMKEKGEFAYVQKRGDSCCTTCGNYIRAWSAMEMDVLKRLVEEDV